MTAIESVSVPVAQAKVKVYRPWPAWIEVMCFPGLLGLMLVMIVLLHAVALLDLVFGPKGEKE